MINENLNIFDIRKIYEQYKKEYDFLYEHGDNVAGYEDAIKHYEENIEKWLENEFFRKYLFTLCAFKQDCFTSDREVAALMFACNDHYMFLD